MTTFECVTCGEPAEGKTCAECNRPTCWKHLYADNLCCECDTYRQAEEYGVQLHGRTEAR